MGHAFFSPDWAKAIDRFEIYPAVLEIFAIYILFGILDD